MTKQKLQKEELVKKLMEQGIPAARNLVQVQKLAKEWNMAIFEENLPKVKEGWEGKSKGILQVLYGRKVLLTHQIWSNTQWMEEWMLMAFTNPIQVSNIFLGLQGLQEQGIVVAIDMGRTMGMLVDQTPKIHCESASKGIKLGWGCAKNLYHQQPQREKWSKETFKMTVRKCLLRNNLTMEHIRSFSRYAWQYILAYLAMQQVNDQQSSMGTQASPSGQIMPAKIQKLV